MNKVVFFRVALSADVQVLLSASQTRFPDVPEDGILVTDDPRDLMKFAFSVDGANVSGEGTHILYAAEGLSDKERKFIDRCAELGVITVAVVDPFETCDTSDVQALGEWVASGKMPAPPPATPTDPLESMFGDFLGDVPAAPPVPGEDLVVEEAVVEDFVVPEPAVSEPVAADTSWDMEVAEVPAAPEPDSFDLVDDEEPFVPPPAPPTPGDEVEDIAPLPVQPMPDAPTPPPISDAEDFWSAAAIKSEATPVTAPAPTPTVDDEGWTADLQGEADDDVFPVGEPVVNTVKARDFDEPAPPPALDMNWDLPVAATPMPPAPEDVPEPVRALAIAPEMRPARKPTTISDDTNNFAEWAEAAEAPRAAAAAEAAAEAAMPEPEPLEVADTVIPEDATDYGMFEEAPEKTPEPIRAPEEPSHPLAASKAARAHAGLSGVALPGMRKGVSVLVTGSHGGSGKTTIAFLMPYVMAYLQHKPVYLIEADYSNPKLQQRMSLRADQTTAEFADFVKSLSNGGAASLTPDQVREQTRAVIDRISYVEPTTGMRIITCPYDTTSRDTDDLRDAIQKLVNVLVANEDCYVFLDGQTFSKDDILDATLAATADAVVLVGNARHVDDAKSFRHMLTTPKDNGGADVSVDRISIFLNETSHKRGIELLDEFLPVPVIGHLPGIRALSDSSDDERAAWVGDVLRDEDLSDAVTYIARALGNFLPLDDELLPLITRLAARETRPDDGFAPRRKRKGLFARSK